LTLAHLLLVALVQGVTEFIPVSSSAHLILLPTVTGWVDQGLNIDIAAHLGSLAAVIVYLHQDIICLLRGSANILLGRANADGRLILWLVVASAPAILVGGILVNFNANLFRNIEIVAWATLIGAAVLMVVDKFGPKSRVIKNMTVKEALGIGIAQILALVPGASRAGVTITAALFCGYDRREAARFSMLLSIPIILAAGGFNAAQLTVRGEIALTQAALLTAALSFLVSYITINFMMEWLRHASYMPFIIYRIAIGVTLLLCIYTDVSPV
tara:strand:- start:620 stop:1432 length:813 start_codon:yes stop_codon:yes gene_type:complete